MDKARQLGLNEAAVLDPAPYVEKAGGGLREMLARSGSLLLLASGGRKYWEAFSDALTNSHPHLRQSANPLDDWFESCAETLAPMMEDLAVLGWKSSAVRETEPIPFQRLAMDAGLAVPGRLGVLLHPEYGPWLGLRLVFFLGRTLPFSEKTGFRPCDACAAPCQTACHGNAVKEPGHFNWMACTLTHKTKAVCKSRCDARLACPIGEAHRPEMNTMAYHMTGDREFLPLK